MEEEAKLEFTITVNWRREDGSIATTQLGTLDRGACRSAEDVGLQLADAKPILGRLQEIVVSEQLQRYCEAVRPCPRCHRRRHLKDYRCRRFDTVFGRLGVRAPRFDGCRHCGEQAASAPSQALLCFRPRWERPASYRGGSSCGLTPRTCSSDGSSKRGCRPTIRLTHSGRPASRTFWKMTAP